MATINITVEDHSIRVDNLIELAQGSNNFDTCAFTFDSSWDGFTLYASMYQNPKNVFKLPLDESNTCKIPVNVLQKSGWLYIGARGEKDDETIGTSIVVKLPVRNGAVNGNETGQEMLDQSQYEYLLGKVNELNEKCESLTKELENDFSQLSDDLNDYDERISAIEKGSGNGGSSLPDELKHAWKGHIEEVAYISTEHPYTDALHTLLGGSSDEPTPTKTLTSISASYSGGSVDVGTSLNSLKSNLVVKAIYSDGTQETITGYTLSGTIQEGNNDITVSYGGKTTTFNVVGNATVNPPADDVSNETKWTNGVVYTYEPVQNSYVETNGTITSYNGWARTPYLYCEGASKLRILVNTASSINKSINYNAFYDENKVFIDKFSYDLAIANVGEYVDIDVPENAVYFIVSNKAQSWGSTNPVVPNYLSAIPIA